MRATMDYFDDIPHQPIRAEVRIEGEAAVLLFDKTYNQVHIRVPARMQSCLETIARVFNECIELKPKDGLTPVHDDRGQYIGLARVEYPFRNVE